MVQLLFQTLQMMALTFAIGFVVASLVKAIAVAADRFEFHRIHYDEYQRQKKLRKKRRVRRIYEILFSGSSTSDYDFSSEYYGVSRGDASVDLTEEFFRGVSRGTDDYNIIDYYYPKEKNKK